MSSGPQTAETARVPTVFDDDAPEVSRTYAEAIVNAATTEGQAEEAIAELEAIVQDVLRPFPRFAELLTSPSRPAHEKDRILVQTFEGRALPVVVRFLRVLNRHGRLSVLPAIVHRAREIWDQRQNRVRVLVRSAMPLDDAQQAALRNRLTQLTAATPVIDLQVDRSLLGGLVVQVGDDVYDASVRNRLEQLRRRLIEGKTHEIQSRRDHFSYPA